MKKKITALAVKSCPLLLLEIMMSAAVSVCVTKGNSIISKLVDEMLTGTQVNPGGMIYVFAGLVAVGFAASFVKAFSAGAFANTVAAKYRRLVAEKLYRIEYRCLAANNTGTILNKISGDIKEICEFLNTTLPGIIGDFMATLVYAVYIARMNLSLFIIMIVVYPLIFRIANRFARKVQELTQTHREKTDNMADIAQSAVSGILIVRAFGLEKSFKKRMDAAAKALVENEQKRVSITNTMMIVKQMLQWLPNIICALYAAFLVSRGVFSIGSLLAFVLILSRFVQSFIELPFLFVDAAAGIVSINRMENILAEKEETGGDYKGEEIENDGKVIELEALSFAYEKENVLDGINLTIHAGDNIAFVGESGGGKSTIVSLLCGLYDDYKGSIRLGGRDVREWDKEALREKISLVSQDVFLFPASIEENVAFGAENATHEDIVRACREADIHDFIETLPDGYDTVIGEKGKGLSGGQKQRLSIARAILKNAPVLIMDEPTSSVDVTAENEIRKALEKIGHGRTCITIAHRLNTIKSCNHVYRLKDGRLTEERMGAQ